jgi:hypothetical protein
MRAARRADKRPREHRSRPDRRQLRKCPGTVSGIAWLYAKYEVANLTAVVSSLRQWLKYAFRLLQREPENAAALVAWVMGAVCCVRNAEDEIERSVDGNRFVPASQKLMLRCMVDAERDRLSALVADFSHRLNENSVCNVLHVLRCTPTKPINLESRSLLLSLPTVLLVRIVSLLDGQFVFVLRDSQSNTANKQ